MAESSQGWRRLRHPGWIAGGLVAIATLIIAVVEVLDYVRPSNGSALEEVVNPSAAPGRQPVPGVPTDGPSQINGSDDTAAPALVRLVDLTPISGADRLAPLPRELAGTAGYEQALVIRCPSNETGERHTEVIYETRNRFVSLDADLRPYRDPPDDVLVNLWVFSDPQDRLPGAPPPGQPHLEQLRMGETGAVHEVEISESYYLRLRIVCEKPDGFLILTRAELRPAAS